MNYFAECLAKFQSLPDNVREIFGGVETYAALREIEESYNIKLSFLLILLAVGELEEEDVSEYLSLKFKLPAEKAEKIKNELMEKVFDPAWEKTLGTEEEAAAAKFNKEEIANLFSRRIVESLGADSETIKGLNIAIFQAFNDDDNLEDEALNLLYNNNEILTSGHLRADDRELAPTIANWLKDFIKANGSGMFDELVLAQYLSASPNTKSLPAPEKDRLKRILKLYRNLAFFPESMDGIRLEDWEIIPADGARKPSGKFEDALSDDEVPAKAAAPAPRPSAIKPVAATKPVAVKAAAASSKVPQAAAKPVAKAAGNAAEMDELQQALSHYSSGSLEYKAITQEIERLKKKK